jgi:tRNA wybutosine-synthesizing protein 1
MCESLRFLLEVYYFIFNCTDRSILSRSHTNPVGTEWKWEMDDAETVIKGALEGHYAMIKQLKGVPGVLDERFKEAMEVRHCALSLVGKETQMNCI